MGGGGETVANINTDVIKVTSRVTVRKKSGRSVILEERKFRYHLKACSEHTFIVIKGND